jgi:hypothetical protein
MHIHVRNHVFLHRKINLNPSRYHIHMVYRLKVNCVNGLTQPT